MDYEKKYKEALERANKFYNNEECSVGMTPIDLEVIFPELKDSEDERIRGAIIDHLKDNNLTEWAAWLEKQCKEKYTLNPSKDEDVRKLMGYIEKQAKAYDIDLPVRGYDIYAFTKDILAWLEKQGEQNPANSAKTCKADDAWLWYLSCKESEKPKFHEGDWIIRIAKGFKHNTYLVTEVKDYYVCEDLKGRRVTFTFNDVHKNFKLWNISDAKNGNVLASNSGVFLFQEEYIAEKPIAYCGIMNGRFIKGEDGCWTNERYYPATKEQRDTLMKAMTDAGWKFDFEKKELKEIKKKPAWSEEDESIALGIESLVSCASLLNIAPDRLDTIKDWLKSLKERYTWKPSDEQINALDSILQYSLISHNSYKHLNSLFNDLKKLMEK